jgi:hypothetical protein
MRELERLEGERSQMIARIEMLSRDQDSRQLTHKYTVMQLRYLLT